MKFKKVAEKDHAPRFIYDCERCKFNWCCGYCCSCVLVQKLKLKDPPEKIQYAVNLALLKDGYTTQFKDKIFKGYKVYVIGCDIGVGFTVAETRGKAIYESYISSKEAGFCYDWVEFRAIRANQYDNKVVLYKRIIGQEYVENWVRG